MCNRLSNASERLYWSRIIILADAEKIRKSDGPSNVANSKILILFLFYRYIIDRFKQITNKSLARINTIEDTFGESNNFSLIMQSKNFTVCIYILRAVFVL